MNAHPSVSVDSSWLSWGEWSHCSLSCGNGNRNRGRGCTGRLKPTCFEHPNLLAAPAFGGQHCSGSTKETEHCNTVPCPGEILALRWCCFANVLPLSLDAIFVTISYPPSELVSLDPMELLQQDMWYWSEGESDMLLVLTSVNVIIYINVTSPKLN